MFLRSTVILVALGMACVVFMMIHFFNNIYTAVQLAANQNYNVLFIRKHHNAEAQNFSQADFDEVKVVAGAAEVLPYHYTDIESISSANAIYDDVEIFPYAGLVTPNLLAGTLPGPDRHGYILLPFKYLKPLNLGTPTDAVGKNLVLAYRNKGGERQERSLTIDAVIATSIFSTGSAYMSNADVIEIANYQNDGHSVTDKYSAFLVALDKSTTIRELDDIKAELGLKGYDAQTARDQQGELKNIVSLIQWLFILGSAVLGYILYRRAQKYQLGWVPGAGRYKK